MIDAITYMFLEIYIEQEKNIKLYFRGSNGKFFFPKKITFYAGT